MAPRRRLPRRRVVAALVGDALQRALRVPSPQHGDDVPNERVVILGGHGIQQGVENHRHAAAPPLRVRRRRQLQFGLVRRPKHPLDRLDLLLVFPQVPRCAAPALHAPQQSSPASFRLDRHFAGFELLADLHLHRLDHRQLLFKRQRRAEPAALFLLQSLPPSRRRTHLGLAAVQLPPLLLLCLPACLRCRPLAQHRIDRRVDVRYGKGLPTRFEGLAVAGCFGRVRQHISQKTEPFVVRFRHLQGHVEVLDRCLASWAPLRVEARQYRTVQVLPAGLPPQLQLPGAPSRLDLLILTMLLLGSFDELLLRRQRRDGADAALRPVQETSPLRGGPKFLLAAVEVLADPPADHLHNPFALLKRQRPIGPLEDAFRRLAQPSRSLLRRANVRLLPRNPGAPFLGPLPFLLLPQRLCPLEDAAALGQRRRFPVSLEDFETAAPQERLTRFVAPKRFLATLEVGRQAALDDSEHLVPFAVGTRLVPPGCTQSRGAIGRVADRLMPSFPPFGLCTPTLHRVPLVRLGRHDDSAALGERLGLPPGVAEDLETAAPQELHAGDVAPDPLLAPSEVLGKIRLHNRQRRDLLLPGGFSEARCKQPRMTVPRRLLDDRPAAVDLLVERHDPSARVVDRGVDVRRSRGSGSPTPGVERAQLLLEEDPLVPGQRVDAFLATRCGSTLLRLCVVEQLLDFRGPARRPQLGQIPEERIRRLGFMKGIEAVHLLLGPDQALLSATTIEQPAALPPSRFQLGELARIQPRAVDRGRGRLPVALAERPRTQRLLTTFQRFIRTALRVAHHRRARRQHPGPLPFPEQLLLRRRQQFRPDRQRTQCFLPLVQITLSRPVRVRVRS